MTKVGGEVDAFCGRCELVLAHTVHAVLANRPVKVECNTCHAVHRYRSVPGAPASGSAAARKAVRPPRRGGQSVGFDELLAQHTRRAVPYSSGRLLAVDDVVDHVTFGRGFVTAVRGDKVEIAFRSDVRVLVHGRG
jgi:hypothetical protein